MIGASVRVPTTYLPPGCGRGLAEGWGARPGKLAHAPASTIASETHPFAHQASVVDDRDARTGPSGGAS
jgi:hypothetical protein